MCLRLKEGHAEREAHHCRVAAQAAATPLMLTRHLILSPPANPHAFLSPPVSPHVRPTMNIWCDPQEAQNSRHETPAKYSSFHRPRPTSILYDPQGFLLPCSRPLSIKTCPPFRPGAPGLHPHFRPCFCFFRLQRGDLHRHWCSLRSLCMLQ